jgi:hypothetical protein
MSDSDAKRRDGATVLYKLPSGEPVVDVGMDIVTGRLDFSPLIDCGQRHFGQVLLAVPILQHYARSFDMIDRSAHEAALREQAEQFEAAHEELTQFRVSARQSIDALVRDLEAERDAREKAEERITAAEAERDAANEERDAAKVTLRGLGRRKPKPKPEAEPVETGAVEEPA